ncbi:hypothetical protein [Streptomyces sp. NPDC046685]|uniref:hypothetical protein n=1 Tax=Streptomyces sp. NPDC046685 TaxID=3157202 RepID=UPI0033ECCDD5
MVTLDEVHRIMDRERQAGEPEGADWWCWDGLIVRDAGVPSMVKVIDGLVATGEHETVLRYLGPADRPYSFVAAWGRPGLAVSGLAAPPRHVRA